MFDHHHLYTAMLAISSPHDEEFLLDHLNELKKAPGGLETYHLSESNKPTSKKVIYQYDKETKKTTQKILAPDAKPYRGILLDHPCGSEQVINMQNILSQVNGLSLLHVAVRLNLLRIVKFLLDLNTVNVNAVCSWALYELEFELRNPTVLRRFLHHATPLDFAQKGKNQQMVELLIAHGACCVSELAKIDNGFSAIPVGNKKENNISGIPDISETILDDIKDEKPIMKMDVDDAQQVDFGAICGLKRIALPKGDASLLKAIAISGGQDYEVLKNIVFKKIRHQSEYTSLEILPGVEQEIKNSIEDNSINQIRGDELILLLGRPIVILDDNLNIINALQYEQIESAPIFVHYQGDNHYDALILRPLHTAMEVLSNIIEINETNQLNNPINNLLSMLDFISLTAMSLVYHSTTHVEQVLYNQLMKHIANHLYDNEEDTEYFSSILVTFEYTAKPILFTVRASVYRLLLNLKDEASAKKLGYFTQLTHAFKNTDNGIKASLASDKSTITSSKYIQTVNNEFVYMQSSSVSTRQLWKKRRLESTFFNPSSPGLTTTAMIDEHLKAREPAVNSSADITPLVDMSKKARRAVIAASLPGIRQKQQEKSNIHVPRRNSRKVHWKIGEFSVTIQYNVNAKYKNNAVILDLGSYRSINKKLKCLFGETPENHAKFAQIMIEFARNETKKGLLKSLCQKYKVGENWNIRDYEYVIKVYALIMIQERAMRNGCNSNHDGLPFGIAIAEQLTLLAKGEVTLDHTINQILSESNLYLPAPCGPATGKSALSYNLRNTYAAFHRLDKTYRTSVTADVAIDDELDEVMRHAGFELVPTEYHYRKLLEDTFGDTSDLEDEGLTCKI